MPGQIIGTILTLLLVVLTYGAAREHEREKVNRRLLSLMDKARKREGVMTVTCIEVLDEFDVPKENV